MAVEFTEHLDDGLFELLHVAEEVVVERAPLEVSPKAFECVEFRRVLREPDDEDMVLVLGQQVERRLRRVIARVVEEIEAGAPLKCPLLGNSRNAFFSS